MVKPVDQPTKRVPILAVYVSERAIERVVATLRSGYIGDGPVVREFEAKVADRVGARHAVAVNSCTSALSLALALYDIGPGDEVITTAQTFAATSHAILAAGAAPVYADVQYMTGNLEPADIEHRITPRTRAILPVHWAGYPCDMDDILEIAGRHDLPVIEDAAQALGAVYRGRPIGSLSPITCFSFQAVKQLTTVDGGMLCLQDDCLAEAARRRRWFGIDRARRKPTLLGEPEWDISEVGYKYHMNDVMASLGSVHIDEFTEIHRRLAEIHARYRADLAQSPGLTLFEAKPDRESGYWTFCLHVARREDFLRAVRARGVDASVIHLRIDNNTVFGPRRPDLPNLERLTDTMVCLPLHYMLTDEDAQHVIDSVRKGW
jgi:perosamine synthetase